MRGFDLLRLFHEGEAEPSVRKIKLPKGEEEWGSKGKEADYFSKLLQAARKMGPDVTAAKMKKCVWVRPDIVAQIEFLEWTDADHLRHSRFAGLRDDKEAGPGSP